MGFDEATLNNIGIMSRMSKTLPDDFFMTGAMQELAQVMTRLDVSEDDQAVLYGVGALLIREGKREFQAEVMAKFALHKARQPRERDDGR
ncbi:hypothetical protein [Sphingosinicella sp.]|uniref:hypothetical protein n=1 Tax=Sphingosinicella sp. TaxID=1917971 RepID=UPI002638A9B2|nr:hypothetical protein [Sphingosinicella sp.]